MKKINGSVGGQTMGTALHDYVVSFIIFIFGVIMTFFWKSKGDQDARIARAEESGDKAHDRITDLANDNNERFARRDDMACVEERLITAMRGGFAEVRKDIRAMNKQ